MMKDKKTWLITGASQGLGLNLAKHLLINDQRVIITTRDVNKIDKAFLNNPNLEAISLDLTDEEAVKSAIDQIISKYGCIDVLVNNAGYGFVGAIEETSAKEAEQVIAINVHATLRMIRIVLPNMRKNQTGHIINLSSIAGLIGSSGWGIYNASKFAIEGISEALAQEVKDLGIKVTMVEPGAVRTNFLAGSLTSSQIVIDDYAATAGQRRKTLAGNNGKQPNDPQKVVKAIYDVVQMPDPPLRLLLGPDAYSRAMEKIQNLTADFEGMKDLTLSTAF
jgi:short-subunit dehydrogenase